MMERNNRRYTMDYGDTPGASGESRFGDSWEVDFDETGMYVRIDEGSGYMSQTCSATIPFEAVEEMLRRYRAREAWKEDR